MSVHVTTTYTGPRKKPFAFSYSRLKNFESCPKRHLHVDIKKDVKEEDSDALLWGNQLHKSFAERLAKGTPLPASMEKFEPLIKKFEGPGLIKVEQQLAIKEDLTATEWFAKDAWYRGVADLIRIQGPVALAADWKTGKIKEDGVQLGLMAACIFAHFPEVQAIRTEFVWIAEDATSRADFRRKDMVGLWTGVLPRVALLKQAYEADEYPPKPGGLCKRYCPVEACKYHGT